MVLNFQSIIKDEVSEPFTGAGIISGLGDPVQFAALSVASLLRGYKSESAGKNPASVNMEVIRGYVER